MMVEDQGNEQRIIAVIPARYQSTRFPGKPLVEIHGKPMILWTLGRTLSADCVDHAIVATDHPDIYRVVTDAGGTAVMTPTDLTSGSDRVATAIRDIPGMFIINVQGDEPVIEPSAIDAAVKALHADSEAVVSTLAARIRTGRELWDENVVKVWVNRKNQAVTFSRIPVPYPGNRMQSDCFLKSTHFYRHIGLYVFRREYLMEFTRSDPCEAERIENLEQLRILDAGQTIHICEIESASPGVDVPKDLVDIELYIRDREILFPSQAFEKNGVED
jgi:3-deoxy-manno-octulosonate cytidylyltransferase (CMP-KDO synthetase)